MTGLFNRNKWVYTTGNRLLMLLISMLGIYTVVFLISINIPGDPVNAIVGERADEHVIQFYREKFGLDQSVWHRYVLQLKAFLGGDFGISYSTGRPVMEEILEKLPHTLCLASCGMFISIILSLWLGTLSAMKRDSLIDQTIRVFCTALISFPVFWFALLLLYVFAIIFPLFPPGGTYSFAHVILPSLTLGLRSTGYMTRLVRTAMIEHLNSEYILMVRAKGGKTSDIWIHAFRNAMIPVITFMTLDFASYLNGSVLTETIFAWDGLGRYAVWGIYKRDYPVILGVVLWGGLIYLIFNMLVDICYKKLNPHIGKY